LGLNESLERGRAARALGPDLRFGISVILASGPPVGRPPGRPPGRGLPPCERGGFSNIFWYSPRAPPLGTPCRRPRGSGVPCGRDHSAAQRSGLRFTPLELNRSLERGEGGPGPWPGPSVWYFCKSTFLLWAHLSGGPEGLFQSTGSSSGHAFQAAQRVTLPAQVLQTWPGRHSSACFLTN